MVVVAQLVRVLVCGAEGRRFEPGQPPQKKSPEFTQDFFYFFIVHPTCQRLVFSLYLQSHKLLHRHILF